MARVLAVTEQGGAAGAGQGEREEALQAAEVQLDGERDADGDVVDVGGEHLPLGPLGGGGADEGGAAAQQRTDEARIAVRVERHPVAGADDPHRVAGHHERRVGADVAVGGDHVALTAVDPHDASRHEPLLGVRGESSRPVLVPAVRSQRVRGGRSGRERERQGNPSQGGPGTRARAREGREVGQPVATGMRTMLFRLWAVPIATTVINVLTSWFFPFPCRGRHGEARNSGQISRAPGSGVNSFSAHLRWRRPDRGFAGVGHRSPSIG